MLVRRIGFTPVKGGRHLTQDAADLSADGPVGDRVFCLVDRSSGQVLHTVQHPSLLRTRATWGSGVLSVELAGQRVTGVPTPSGETLRVDYWGRTAQLDLCLGPWAQAYSQYLGRDVVLCRSVSPGEVVYGASVSFVTTSSISRLARRLGREVGSERFRSTFLVDTGDSPAHIEDSWVGQELRVGGATVRVRGAVPRCAVVDLDPASGLADARVLRELATYRLTQSEVRFGVDAVVTAAGRVRAGDQVELATSRSGPVRPAQI